MVYQYAINTEAILDLEELENFFNLISEERRQRILKFHYTKDKVHSLFAEIILRYVLCKQYGFRNEQIKFRYTDYGKPYLAAYKDIHFNLSHSGSWVICVIGEVPLGIDIERMKNKELDIAGRCFTKEERDFIFSQTLQNRVRTFYKLWTLKESYVKNVGMGLSIPFDSFSFRIIKDDIQLLLNGRQDHNFLFYINQLDSLHCTALCVNCKSEDKVNENIKILSLDELLEWNKSMNLNWMKQIQRSSW